MLVNSELSSATRAAKLAYDFVVTVARPHISAGGVMHTKGSKGIPSELRKLIAPIDRCIMPSWTTPAARASEELIVEPVIPLKRVCVKLINPASADPRCNTRFNSIAGGPATSPAHLLEICQSLIEKCLVTRLEHSALNRISKSFQWDTPSGDGWARYRAAGLTWERL